MNATADDAEHEAFHAGEQALQSRVGLRERMAEIGPLVLRDQMPAQHRAFFAQLPSLVVGSIDAQGQPWASMLAASPGFAHSPDPIHLRIDALPDAADPLAASLHEGSALGLLGLEPQTRRRNRMNGRVHDIDARGFSVEVQQSFGNCPKYIQARLPAMVAWPAAPGAVRHFEGVDDAVARRLVASADTFFIASAHPQAGEHGDDASHGVDVSHRGGRPGFVRVDSDGAFTVPDFSGNRFFNTLGNLVLNPRAGLLFVDFERGDVLQLAVRTEIVWDGPEVSAFPGAERFVRFTVTRGVYRPTALPLRWGEAALSPHLTGTGVWGAA
jgi:predicted pyridoxine 5'-phosphate oxidase superfamily flavin-nucleotide-binding protein